MHVIKIKERYSVLKKMFLRRCFYVTLTFSLIIKVINILYFLTFSSFRQIHAVIVFNFIQREPNLRTLIKSHFHNAFLHMCTLFC